MPVLLPNVLITTARSSYSAGTGTTAPVTHVTNLLCHLAPVRASQLTTLPQDALSSQYVLTIPSGTDIVIGDTITSIVLNDGVSPWPGFSVAATYIVRFTQEQAPFTLDYRAVFVEMVLTGGRAF